jgi:4,4'-diaponeurosporenoate glycosyltransferase
MSLWFALLVACGIFFFAAKSREAYLDLEELPVRPEPLEPDLVTVIIPARNEAANIARAVASFASQAPVIVVNDGSTDDTARLAAEAGATVIEPPPLRTGELGKPNACLAGARAARTPWLLFVDADTRFLPEFLPSLLHHARENSLLMASAFLKQETLTVFEEILVPYAFGLYFTGVNPNHIHDLKRSEALANGQCLLMRADAYEFTSGHKAVLTSVIEDVALAQVAKRHRVKNQLLRAEHLGTVRMYDSFGAILRGFQKNSFRFLLTNPGTGAQVILASILFTSYLPMLFWLQAEGHRFFTFLYLFLPSVALLRWWQHARGALFAPLAIYLFQLIALNGMFTVILGRKANWKGRRV